MYTLMFCSSVSKWGTYCAASFRRWRSLWRIPWTVPNERESLALTSRGSSFTSLATAATLLSVFLNAFLAPISLVGVVPPFSRFWVHSAVHLLIVEHEAALTPTTVFKSLEIFNNVLIKLQSCKGIPFFAHSHSQWCSWECSCSAIVESLRTCPWFFSSEDT